MSSWVLFTKDGSCAGSSHEQSRIAILPEQYRKNVKGAIIEIVTGTFADACNRASAIEDERRSKR